MAAFIIIGFVWVIVVGGAALRVRAERIESIDAFQRQLRAFAPGLPSLDDDNRFHSIAEIRGASATAGTAELLRRILAALLVTVAVSFLVALAAGTRTAWCIHLLIDNALIAYLALLVHRRDKLASSGTELAAPRPRLAFPRGVRRGRVATIT
jgi:hypothetical protein